MTYVAFKKWAAKEGLTLAQLRCDDAPPTGPMLDVMDRIGLAAYERFVARLQREDGVGQ